jgi:hypothetical protein
MIPGVVTGEVYLPVADKVVVRLETDSGHHSDYEEERGDVIPVLKGLKDGLPSVFGPVNNGMTAIVVCFTARTYCTD